MRTYLVDDRGAGGEYAHFLAAHGDRLPGIELQVLTNWSQLVAQLEVLEPHLILLDMHFDEGPAEALCGDLETLSNSARFSGDRERAEAQLRRMQGVFIVQALRENAGYRGPIILFGTLPRPQSDRLLEKYAPLRIVEGLLFEGVRESLEWARAQLATQS